jgi:hypothetical protein
VKIDVSIVNFTGEDATYYKIRYARIDNISSPVYNTISGNITASQFPYSIQNIDNGQYSVGITPVYNDGRKCNETFKNTDACIPIIAINAVIDNGNFKITYTANGDVPQVLLTINYPNGGSYQQAYTNGANSSTILVPIPANLYGDYNFYMQSICDPDTNFYSVLSAPTIVNVAQPSSNPNHLVTVRMLASVSYWNTKTDACAAINSTGAGFTVQSIYVKDSDWLNYLAGIAVDAYSDAECTVNLTDNTIPVSSTKERVIFTTAPLPNVWQTDSNHLVSIKLENC